MNSNDYWNIFCKSGSIQSYLEYAKSAEREQNGNDSNSINSETFGLSSLQWK